MSDHLTDALARLYRPDLIGLIRAMDRLADPRDRKQIRILALYLGSDQVGRQRILDHLDAMAAADPDLGPFRDLIDGWE